jgi:hypothetical protein
MYPMLLVSGPDPVHWLWLGESDHATGPTDPNDFPLNVVFLPFAMGLPIGSNQLHELA